MLIVFHVKIDLGKSETNVEPKSFIAALQYFKCHLIHLSLIVRLLIKVSGYSIKYGIESVREIFSGYFINLFQ